MRKLGNHFTGSFSANFQGGVTKKSFIPTYKLFQNNLWVSVYGKFVILDINSESRNFCRFLPSDCTYNMRLTLNYF